MIASKRNIPRDDGYIRRRNTGLELKWNFSEGQSDSFQSYNGQFIRFANYLHEGDADSQNFLEGMTSLALRINRDQEGYDECEVRGYHGGPDLGQVREGSVFRENLTRHTLELAAKSYFDAMFCTDHDPKMVEFYQNLLETFPLETVLKSLARILLVSNKKRLTSDYIIAKALFDKLTTMMNLQYKDILLLTTGAAETELYEDIENHQMDPEFRDLSRVGGMIKHPVHISDNNKLSSLIPFCSFGDDLNQVGRRVRGFSKPVCSIFREKILSRQVCYEADLSQLQLKRKQKLKQTLKQGLSFVIDINDEYNVKNLMKRKSPEKEEKSSSEYLFKQSEKDESPEIRLKTISRYH